MRLFISNALLAMGGEGDEPLLAGPPITPPRDGAIILPMGFDTVGFSVGILDIGANPGIVELFVLPLDLVIKETFFRHLQAGNKISHRIGEQIC